MEILVVDDSSAIRKQLGQILEDAGHACDFAADGLEAIRHSLGKAYDLIITDIQMPVLDGLKFLQRIRTSHKTEATPVIVLSAHGDAAMVTQAVELGISGYVLKPVDSASLLARIGELPATA